MCKCITARSLKIALKTGKKKNKQRRGKSGKKRKRRGIRFFRDFTQSPLSPLVPRATLHGDILMYASSLLFPEDGWRPLRRRSHVEQKIRGSGISRIRCQFVLELLQRYRVHRFVVAFQPGNGLLVTPDAATIHATTSDFLYRLLLALGVCAGFTPKIPEDARCFLGRGRGRGWRRRGGRRRRRGRGGGWGESGCGWRVRDTTFAARTIRSFVVIAIALEIFRVRGLVR